MKLISRIFKKGMDPRVDSYSAFYDNDHKTKTRLSEYLKANGVTDLFVVGLAEDYCVGYSALDAQKEGFRTTVVTDATQCVAEDSQRKMRKKLEKAGVEMTTSEELLENSPFFSKRK
jgi:nicotinamidase/pyrazinamidase